MTSTEDDDRAAQPPSGTPDPPYQALLPNFDKVSRSAFRRGTVSRRRIGIALVIFAGAGAIAAVLIIASIM